MRFAWLAFHLDELLFHVGDQYGFNNMKIIVHFFLFWVHGQGIKLEVSLHACLEEISTKQCTSE